jgi:hypothetical protein
VDAINNIKENCISIYASYDVQSPESFFEESFFEDCTKDIEKHQTNINCYDLNSMLDELNISHTQCVVSMGLHQVLFSSQAL